METLPQTITLLLVRPFPITSPSIQHRQRRPSKEKHGQQLPKSPTILLQRPLVAQPPAPIDPRTHLAQLDDRPYPDDPRSKQDCETYDAQPPEEAAALCTVFHVADLLAAPGLEVVRENVSYRKNCADKVEYRNNDVCGEAAEVFVWPCDVFEPRIRLGVYKLETDGREDKRGVNYWLAAIRDAGGEDCCETAAEDKACKNDLDTYKAKTDGREEFVAVGIAPEDKDSGQV